MTGNISLVIPNWNGKRLLEKNIPLWIAALKNKKNHIAEIIIVDDFSKDDSVSFIKKNYEKEIRLVRHKANRGFAAAVNTGFRSSKTQLICLINTDVVPKENFLEEINLVFKDKKVFGVSLHEKGFGYSKGLFEDGFIVHAPVKEKKGTYSTFWISGGSGVFVRKYWIELGGFDEKIYSPFYWEDVDLSYRALKRGYKLLWSSSAEVLHEHESTINSNNFRKAFVSIIKERNHLLFNWKNLTSSALLKKHRVSLFKKCLRHPGYVKVVFLAILKLRSVLKARKKELKESIVSDEAIFAIFTD